MSPDILTVDDAPTWSGTNVTISDVVKAVEDLRRREQKAATRASVATLVIMARSADEVDDAETVIDHLGVRHPARIITLLVPRGADEGENRIDAEVTLHAGEASGHAIWSDELRLKVSGDPVMHLESVLRPLQLADLPIVVWYVRGLPDVGDPLLKLANAVIVDSKTAADVGEGEPAMLQVFREVSRLSRKQTIIDLSWSRLKPWRSLMASLFSGEVFRPFIYGVERIEVTGKIGPRILLSGWMNSRLHVERSSMHLYDGRHVAMSLFCRVGEATAEFTVERVPNERLVRSSAVIHDGPSHNELLALPKIALPMSLSDALRKIERDRVYEQAIKSISAWESGFPRPGVNV